MRHRVALAGRGRAELAAYGMADAEHQVQKELAAVWPGARVDVLGVSRVGAHGHIVEEFAVDYRVTGTLEVDADDAASARPAALRLLRDRLSGTRHARIEWEPEKE